MLKKNRRVSKTPKVYARLQQQDAGRFLLNTCDSDTTIHWKECVPECFKLPINPHLINGTDRVSMRDHSGRRIQLDREFIVAKLRHQFVVPLGCEVTWEEMQALLREAWVSCDLGLHTLT